MSIKIVRNDITKMQVDAIVNTANDLPTFGTGCDYAVYNAAGKEELLAIRQKIGAVPEGDVFITPGLKLPAKYIIHAVSPLYIDGESGEEEKLRSCYRKSLELAAEQDIKSIAFPLISTGGFGYPKEEGMRIALDEINAFLMKHELMVYLVMFGSKDVELGKNLDPDLESYIDEHYVEEKKDTEYRGFFSMPMPSEAPRISSTDAAGGAASRISSTGATGGEAPKLYSSGAVDSEPTFCSADAVPATYSKEVSEQEFAVACSDEQEEEEISLELSGLRERMAHMTDTFSEYLLYLIESKGMTNAEVYKRSVVDKKVFSKIKNNSDYQPKKITAMCLCIGAKLNLDEAKDLLARAGYALSPCDKRDIIFSYYTERENYDIIDLDITLEEFGLPCLIE